MALRPGLAGGGASKTLEVTNLPVADAAIALVPTIRYASLEANNKVPEMKNALGHFDLKQTDSSKQPVLKIDPKSRTELVFSTSDGMKTDDIATNSVINPSNQALSFMFVANLTIRLMSIPQTQWAWNEGDRQVICQLMTDANGKITIAFNDSAGGKWEKDNTALVADTISAVFCQRLGDSVEVWVNGVSEGVQTITSPFHTQWATGATATSAFISEPTNLALGSAGLMTLTTDITNWWNFGINTTTASSLAATVDGVTAGTRRLSYPVYPVAADGKFFKFKFNVGSFVFNRLVFHNRSNSTGTVLDRILNSRLNYLLKGTVVATELIDNNAEASTWTAAAGMTIDEVELVFSGDVQNFREIEIFGIPLVNIALGSANLMTLTTNVPSFWNGTLLAATVDGVTSGSGTLAYAVVPDHADGKSFYFKSNVGSFIMDRLVFYNRNDLASSHVAVQRILNGRFNYLLNGVVVATELIDNSAHESTWTAAQGMEIDEVELVFSGRYQNFREIEIFARAFIKHSQKMTGAPDTAMAVGTDHQRHANAWAEAAEQRGDAQTITLSYAEAIEIKQVIIREVFNPGSISALEVLNGTDWITVYSRTGAVGTDGIIANPTETGGTMSNFTVGKVSDTTIELTKTVAFSSSQIRLTIGNAVVHYNEVDAVQIAGYSGANSAPLSLGYNPDTTNPTTPAAFDFYSLLIYPRVLSAEERNKMFLYTEKNYGV